LNTVPDDGDEPTPRADIETTMMADRGIRLSPRAPGQIARLDSAIDNFVNQPS
jgi:hypothetical protein